MFNVLGEAATETAEWISDYNSNKPTLLGCDCSTTYKNKKWLCLYGLKGMMQDAEQKQWATNNQGLGGFIRVQFAAEMNINSFQMISRKNKEYMMTKMKVEYEGGDIEFDIA